MQSKTSFFNKTIFFKNITRFWPIWVSYLLVCLYRLPMRLYLTLNASCPDNIERNAFLLSQLKGTVLAALTPLPIFLFACITAVAVFSYLYQAKSAYMIHSLPVCRESLFITHVLSGILFLTIPQVIAFLAGIFVCFLQRMTQLEYLLHWLILSTGMVVFAFALAVFTVMITGNIIAAPAFYIAVNFLFMACRNAISGIIELFSYGVRSDTLEFGSFLSPFFRLSQIFPDSYYSIYYGFAYGDEALTFSLSEAYHCIGGYCIAILPLLLLAFFLYRHKQLETAGDVVTIPFLRPLLRWAITFCVSSFLAVTAIRMLHSDETVPASLPLFLILSLIGSVLVFFLSEMLMQKKFMIFKKRLFVECGVFVSLSLLFAVSADLNLFGVETRIPAESDIEAVYLNGEYSITVRTEDFSKVLEIHQGLIDSKEEIERYTRKYGMTERNMYLTLRYVLKNGRTLTRFYQIPIEDYYLDKEDFVCRKLMELFNTPDYYLRYHFTDAYESVTLISGTLDQYMDDFPYTKTIGLDSEQCQQLMEAFKQDVAEGNYQICNYRTDEDYSNLSLMLSYRVPVGSSYPIYLDTAQITDPDELQTTSINLNGSCVHTLDALVELGLLSEDHTVIQGW